MLRPDKCPTCKVRDKEVYEDDYVNDGEVIPKTNTEPNILRLYRILGGQVDIDLSELETPNTFVISGSVNDENNLELKRNDGETIPIDMSNFSTEDDYVVSGKFAENPNLCPRPEQNKLELILTRKSGEEVKINACEVASDDYVVSGKVLDNYVLELTRRSFKKVNIDIGNLKGEDGAKGDKGDKGDKGEPGTGYLIERYRINTVDEDYTTLPADFDGATVIRANKNGDQSITITKPPAELEESFRGCCLIIRKSNGDAGTFTNLLAGEGVVFSPDDITPLRRIGNYAGLMYIGNGLYDAGGELP